MKKQNLQTKNTKPETVDPLVRDSILSALINSSTVGHRLSLADFERLDPQFANRRQTSTSRGCLPAEATH